MAEEIGCGNDTFLAKLAEKINWDKKLNICTVKIIKNKMWIKNSKMKKKLNMCELCNYKWEKTRLKR